MGTAGGSDNSDGHDLALIVHGSSLVHIQADRRLERKLLQFGKLCKAVVACRVSPAQKAGIVRMVQLGVSPTPITLAIEDLTYSVKVPNPDGKGKVDKMLLNGISG